MELREMPHLSKMLRPKTLWNQHQQSFMSWATSSEVMRSCTMVLLVRKWRSWFSWVPLSTRDWNIWSMTRCTLEVVVQSKFWLDSQQKVDLETVDLDSERWSVTAWFLTVQLASWKSASLRSVTATACISVKLVVSFAKPIWLSRNSSAQFVRLLKISAESMFLTRANCWFKS